MLLNATPDTLGVIPSGDVARFAELGAEIDRRFSSPLKSVSDIKGNEAIITFDTPTTVNHIVTMEDYREGERIRAYQLDGWVNDHWEPIYAGSSVGRKKIDFFDDITVSKIRLCITKSVAEPLIRSFTAYYISNTPELFEKDEKPLSDWKYLNSWMPDMFHERKMDININLTPYIPVPGQYEIKINHGKQDLISVRNAELIYDGERALDEFVTNKDSLVMINRTAQVTNETSILIKLTLSAKDSVKESGYIYFRKIP